MHHFYHKLPSLYHGLRTILYPKAFRVIVKIQWAADYSKNLRNLLSFLMRFKSLPSRKSLRLIKLKVYIISVGRLCPFKGLIPSSRPLCTFIQSTSICVLRFMGKAPARASAKPHQLFKPSGKSLISVGQLKIFIKNLLKVCCSNTKSSGEPDC